MTTPLRLSLAALLLLGLVCSDDTDTPPGKDKGIDMAADVGAGRGNCQATKPGETITTANGVIIDGKLNLPGEAPIHATQMFAANMLAFLKEIVDTSGEQPQLKLDVEDEVQKGALITHGGQVVNEMVAKAMEGSS